MSFTSTVDRPIRPQGKRGRRLPAAGRRAVFVALALFAVVAAITVVAVAFDLVSIKVVSNPNDSANPRNASETPRATITLGDRLGPRGRLHFATAGDAAKPVVLFVHGSPGSWDAFADYLGDRDLAERAFLISVDRPGFGQTSPGRAEPSIAAQVEWILPVLDLAKTQKAILVGHSLGGPVIARFAMDHPDRVAGLLFLASSVDPDLEKLRWYNRLGRLRLVQKLIPLSMVISNREIVPLRGELQKMLPLWGRVTMPTIVVHGTKDSLVPYGNVAFLSKKLPHAEIRSLEGEGHMIPWQRAEDVRRALVDLLARIAEP